MTFYQPGAYDHSVLYATAQLTEGRSARDQPKQPPAKKNGELKRERRTYERRPTFVSLGDCLDVDFCGCFGFVCVWGFGLFPPVFGR